MTTHTVVLTTTTTKTTTTSKPQQRRGGGVGGGRAGSKAAVSSFSGGQERVRVLSLIKVGEGGTAAGRDNQSQVYASIFTSDKLEVYFYTLMKKKSESSALGSRLAFLFSTV